MQQVPKAQYMQLVAEHQKFAMADLSGTISSSERRSWQLVKWQIEQIEDALHGEDIDRLEHFARSHQNLASDIRKLVDARVRVLDADAHGKDNPLAALSTLWDAIRALHLGRGKYVGPLVNGAIPPDADIDGVILTSPNGLHYVELTERSKPGDCLKDDVARVTNCLRECSVDVRYGQLEVLPSGNGQSRLPLGYGCEFVWPPVRKAPLEEGVRILRGLRPVEREFSAFNPSVVGPGSAKIKCTNTS